MIQATRTISGVSRSPTTVTHLPTGSATRFGYLPGDVNADGTSAAVDVLTLIDALNGIVALELHSTDINRSGAVDAADVLRLIDLLSGSEVYDTYLGMSLPLSP